MLLKPIKDDALPDNRQGETTAPNHISRASLMARHPNPCPTSSDDQIVAMGVAAHEFSAVGSYLRSLLGIGEQFLACLDPYRDIRRICFAFQLCGASFL